MNGWQVSSGLDAIDRAVSMTKGLVPSASTPPMGEPLWAACYWRAFQESLGEPESHLLVDDGRPVAFVVVGRPKSLIQQASNLANDHVPIFAVATYGPTDGVHATLGHLLESTSVLTFEPVYREGAFAQHVAAAAAAGGGVSASLPKYPEIAAHLAGPWSDARKRLSSSAVSVAGRRTRQLERLGRLEFDCVEQHAELDALLAECFALEAQGWKGQTGSPIAAEPDTLTFYTELARAYGAIGRMALYTLRLDGRLIAFQYCVRTGDRLDLLKMSYAEDLSRLSPGNVIRLLGYQHELDVRGALNFYMGRVRDWKVIWGTTSYERCRLQVYSGDVAGRLAYAFGPLLRQTVKRVLRRTGLWPRTVAGHAG